MRAYLKAWGIAVLILVVYCALAAAIDAREAHIEGCSIIRCT